MPNDSPSSGGSPVRTVAWNAARGAILASAKALRTTIAGPVIVGITGPVGSGKSTLAQSLGGTPISTDSYLPDYATLAYEDRDRPEHADLGALALDLESLKARGRARIPVWSFHSHRREGFREIEERDLVIVEGIHALHDRALSHLHIAVYIDAPAAVRWARWEVLETAGVRGWGVETARAYFDRVAEPTFRAHEAAYRARAHFIVINAHGVPRQDELA